MEEVASPTGYHFVKFLFIVRDIGHCDFARLVRKWQRGRFMLSMERVFAVLIFAARVNNGSADNPFPWRTQYVHILLKYRPRGLRENYASQ